jgi:hypothetical protein
MKQEESTTLPWLAWHLITAALLFLPAASRDRYRLEWIAELDEMMRQGIAVAIPAFRILLGAPTQGHQLRVAEQRQGSRSELAADARRPFAADLPDLGPEPAGYLFTSDSVDRVFNIVTLECYSAGLWSDKVTNLAATSRRLAACSLRRGAVRGTLRIWDLPYALICEVSDDTMIDDVLAGQRAQVSGDRDGLSSASRKCDLVQLRSTVSGTTVRLHMWK